MTTPNTKAPEGAGYPDDVRDAVNRIVDAAIAAGDDLSTEQLMARAIMAERSRSQWRPIKTAPKDGTKILLGCPESRGYQGVVEKCFWWAQGRKWWDWGCPDRPTHWQPLPAAPKAEG